MRCASRGFLAPGRWRGGAPALTPLLAIAPVAGLGRVVGAAPDLAAGLGYDLEAALMEIDDP
jgi:hypothetical protein